MMPTPNAAALGLGPTLIAVDDLVDEAILRALEPAIAALDTLLGSGPIRPMDGGEPDGYDGFSRVGAIDQLLASDWLLIGEEPDEFIRRYEWRELGYLHRHMTAPRVAPTTLVLFDSGPDQLGRPRIVHLALLIALARRATAAGVPLRWGTLQSPERQRLAGRGALLRLVRSRSIEPPDPAPIDALVDDALVVTPTPVAASHRLVLEEDGAGVVATLIDQRRSTSRRARVPLPDDRHAVRALRDPTRGAPDRVRSADGLRAASNLVFDHAGNKLLTRAPDGTSVLVLPAPNSTNAPPSRVREHRTLSHLPPVTAAGRVGRGTVSVTVVDDHVYVEVLGTHRDWLPKGRVPLRGTIPDSFDPATAALGPMWARGDRLFAVAGETLLAGTKTEFRPVAADLSAMRFGRPPTEVVVQPVDDGWSIEFGVHTFRMDTSDGDLVVGAARTAALGALAVVIGADRRTIELVGPGPDRHFVARSPYEIVDGTAHHHQPIVAVRTTAGGVLLWDWQAGQRRYEWTPP
jgi:hypothetical protein